MKEVDFNSKIAILKNFKSEKNDDPSPEDIKTLAANTNLVYDEVATWFWNKRSKKRKDVTQNISQGSSKDGPPGLTSQSIGAETTIDPALLENPPPVPETFPYINCNEQFLDLSGFPDPTWPSQPTFDHFIPHESGLNVFFPQISQDVSKAASEKHTVRDGVV